MKTRWPYTLAAIAMASAALGCVGDGSGAQDALPRARVEVELLGGFAESALPPPPPHVALLLDATEGMARGVGSGTSGLVAARTGAARLVRALPAEARLDAWVLAADAGATCATPPSSLSASGPQALLSDLERVRAAGRGSLSRALLRAAAVEGAGAAPDRLVAFTALEGGCSEDLCAAARRLADRGVRLELVLLGAATPPRCLATLTRVETGEPILGTTLRSVPFCVETLGAEAAVHACSESGGLPVMVPDERVVVDVQLAPPLRLERSFARGTHWRLQVLDFPATHPPERQWRWQQIPLARPGEATTGEPQPGETP